jgi:hypothetical protein
MPGSAGGPDAATQRRARLGQRFVHQSVVLAEKLGATVLRAPENVGLARAANVLTETGEVIERRIRTEPQRFAEVLGGRPRARILVEASTENEWVARCLEGFEIGPWHTPLAPKRDGYQSISIDVFDVDTLRRRAVEDRTSTRPASRASRTST